MKDIKEIEKSADEDMNAIATLDLGHSEIVDHSDPAFIKMIGTMKIHA